MKHGHIAAAAVVASFADPACAVGLAVLREIDTLKLRQNARDVARTCSASSASSPGQPVHRRVPRPRPLPWNRARARPRDPEPAPEIADYLVNRARSHGVLLSTDGPDHNVINIKPPLVFTRDHADVLVKRLRQTLAELA